MLCPSRRSKDSQGPGIYLSTSFWKRNANAALRHCYGAQFTPTVQSTFLTNFQPLPLHHAKYSGKRQTPLGPRVQTLRAHLVARHCSGPKIPTKHVPEQLWPPVTKRASKPLLRRAACPASPGALWRTRQSPEAYLKHVVSSPEGFRHGYFVVAILFSEQISLGKQLEQPLR